MSPSGRSGMPDVKTLVNAYRTGVFPMARGRDDPGIDWHMGVTTTQDGEILRAFLPLESLHISGSLRKALRRKPYIVEADRDFPSVIRACADMKRPDSQGTWINDAIINSFTALHRAGIAHSMECRDSSGALVGGVYGVAVGRVFCGESLFSRAPEAGKIALVHLAARLWSRGFSLLEIQQVTEFTRHFGARWISLSDYLRALEILRDEKADFSGGEMAQDDILEHYPPVNRRLISKDFKV